MENEDEKKLTTFTKVAIVGIFVAILAIFVVISMTIDRYVKAIIVLALIGLIAKLTQRVIVDINDLWNFFDLYRRLKR